MATTRFFWSLGLLLTLGQSTDALNLSFTGNDCPMNPNDIFSEAAYFNATGMTKFNVQQLDSAATEPWYSILTLMDSRVSDHGHYINRWLAVPKSFLDSETANETAICMYTSNGVDKTLNNKEGNETCDGVVSDDCKEEFDDLKPVSIGSGCPSAPEPGKCNSDGFISTSSAQRLSKSSCQVRSLPGVDVPDEYVILRMLSAGYPADSEPTSYENYDAAIRNPIPSFFAFFSQSGGTVVGDSDPIVQPVCGVPDSVQRDSRKDDDKDDKGDQGDEDDKGDKENKDSLAASLRLTKSAIFALGISGLVAFKLL